MMSSSNPQRDRSQGRLLLLGGLALPVLGVVGFVVQLRLQRLLLPWYLPALALIGVCLVAASVWKRRTWWRVLSLVLVVLIAGAELAALNAMRLPPYHGPLVLGKEFPAFDAKKANGSRFTQNDLFGDQASALVFFRGRW